MSYYFNKAYNWYFDVHPFRPTLEDQKRKDQMVKQIKLMKQFKFKNTKIIINDEEKKTNMILMMNKLKMLNKKLNKEYKNDQ